ncbi:hypothetical protein AAVH_03305 [Aphelenchoides avenae]|nr:hypothetical protein AAVH_03305 [Aphelenchus avenae]
MAENDPSPGWVSYMQLMSILLPVYVALMTVVLVHILINIGVTSMGRGMWRRKVRAILAEMEQEKLREPSLPSQH